MFFAQEAVKLKVEIETRAITYMQDFTVHSQMLRTYIQLVFASVQSCQLVLCPNELNGHPFGFPWSSDNMRKTIRPSLRQNATYVLKSITASNRYWKEPICWARARPVARGPECLNHQLQYLDFTRVSQWIEGAAQVRQGILRYRVNPTRRDPARQLQGTMIMARDMLLHLHDVVNSVLGPEARAEWEEHCLEIEVAGFAGWKRASDLWKQTAWSPSVWL